MSLDMTSMAKALQITERVGEGFHSLSTFHTLQWPYVMYFGGECPYACYLASFAEWIVTQLLRPHLSPSA